LKDASDFLLGEVFLAAFAVYEFGAGQFTLPLTQLSNEVISVSLPLSSVQHRKSDMSSAYKRC
jgi:hypothetical protein